MEDSNNEGGMFSDAESRIRTLINEINFKDPNSINFDALTEAVKNITGCIPSVRPKWRSYQTANEDLVLDGSNKITEKITELEIVYIVDGLPKALKFLV